MSTKHRRVLFSDAVLVALGGLLFGFDTMVISGAEYVLNSPVPIKSKQSAEQGIFNTHLFRIYKNYKVHRLFRILNYKFF